MADDENDLERFRWTCERAIHGHDNRKAAQLVAEIPTDLAIDRYGDGGAVATLEEEIRSILGKPAAVFISSGLMAQQIALRIPGKHPRLEGEGDTSRVLKIGSVAEAKKAERDITKIVKAWCDWRDGGTGKTKR
jgi:hypothetical protein